MELNDYVGKSVIDLVTGRRGVCTGVVFWLYGCEHLRCVFKPRKNQFCVGPEVEYVHPHAVQVESGALDTHGFEIDYGVRDKYLGKEVRDKVSGFEGVCTGIIMTVYSSPMANIDGKCHDNKDIPKKLMDIGRLEITGSGISPEDTQGRDREYTGGDVPAYGGAYEAVY